jgi:hypothetical protein
MHAPHWCIGASQHKQRGQSRCVPHCEIASHNVKSKHAFQSGGVVLKRHTQILDPHPELLRLMANPSSAKTRPLKFFFEKLSGTTRTLLLIMILICAI